MAFEKRGAHARRYFYLSRREGRRVHKVYFGRGPTANQAALLHAAERADDKRARDAEKQLLMQYDSMAHEIAEFCCYAELLAGAALIRVGYHRHKGAWRSRRGRAN